MFNGSDSTRLNLPVVVTTTQMGSHWKGHPSILV